jgi:hypothetical protein
MAPAKRERKQKTADAKKEDENVVFWNVPAAAVKSRQVAAPKSAWEQFGELVGYVRKASEDYARGFRKVFGGLPAPSESPPPAESKHSSAGAKPSVVWDTVDPHFDTLVETDGPYPSLGSARENVKLFLKEKQLSVLDDRTIERHITGKKPHWRIKTGA